MSARLSYRTPGGEKVIQSSNAEGAIDHTQVIAAGLQSARRERVIHSTNHNRRSSA